MTAALAALAGAVLGALVGSFVATLVLRWPAGEQALTGRSRCDRCGKTLRPFELIPLVSHLAARGRCRRCGGAIDPLHLHVELAAAAIGAIALAIAPDLRGLVLALLGWLLLAIGWLDWRHLWLPDALTLMLGLAGVALGGWLGPTLVDRLIGAVAGGGSLALLAWAYARVRHRPGLGAGDPKLVAALGAWLGWMALPPLLLGAAVIGLAVALVRGLRAADALPFGTMLAASGWLLAAAMVRVS